MRIAGAFELLSWPLVVARAATAEIGARVDPLARLLARRLGRRPLALTGSAEERAGAPASDLRARAEAARFWLGPARPAAQPAVAGALADPEPDELPTAYGTDRVVLMPRDPWWAFVFWEITPATREQALAALGDEAPRAHAVLRLYDVTFVDPAGDHAWLSFDVEVAPDTDSAYVNVGRPAASYCAEIGLCTEAGRFLPLARSNVATTPPAVPAADTNVRWLEFGPTGPAWSPDQRPPRPAPERPSGDGQLAPGR